MPTKYEIIHDAVKSHLTAFWIILSVSSVGVRGQEGNGCGHTVLGAESGTLASQNYPGTYPSNTWCKWKLRVSEGRTLQLLFGDFDIESSPGCGNGSLKIADRNGDLSLGPMCGKLEATLMNVTLKSNEVTVSFMSGPHHSGRGFLLSYSSDRYPGLVSCLQRGSHFSSQHVSVYCPAGCRNVTGDVWGSSEQGYRDTSVLCESAVHAGAVSDSQGGHVAVNRGRSLTLYESSFANGILSKMGSLSEKKLLFSKECNNILNASAFNASSSSSGTGGSSFDAQPRPRDGAGQGPWLDLELSDRSNITGIITTGTAQHYIESFLVYFSKDRKTWKLHKDVLSKEKKVFRAHTDGHLRVLNSFFPPTVARFLRLQLLSWHGHTSAQVQVLGCPVAKGTPRIRLFDKSPQVPAIDKPQPETAPTPTEGPVLVETRHSPSKAVMAAVGVVLALLICGSCLLAEVWWKRRRKNSQMKYSLPTSCQSFQSKSLSCSQSEFISYPLERNIHDALPNPPLNNYAEPAVGSIGKKVGSTFRPCSDEDYTTPFAFNHYDSPAGSLPEYAEPLPPEPEYATPFSEQQVPDSHGPPAAAPGTGGWTELRQAQYDCPSHRMLSNGYCTPALHTSRPRPDSGVYAEPKSCDSLLEKHIYEKPL